VRVYLVACLAIVVICVGGYFALNTIQEPTAIAYTTGAARISPHWAWRSVLSPLGASEPTTETATSQECNTREAWQWIFVDFGKPDGESKICKDSQ
jgi:hypothetical protein